MAAPLLSTKLHIPHTRSHGVLRPRLTEKLLAGVTHPGIFVLVSGPAGFGKTTLLSEFAAMPQQPSIAWASLDEADNDPIRFWTYLIAACQTVQSDIGGTVLALLQTPQFLQDETIPTLLINDVVKLQNEMVLVLDDYHLIHNPSIHTAVSFLLDHLPDNLHLFLSTRVDPPWSLARFRARNQLIEIRAADLRFTTEEAAAFLNQVMELNLRPEDVAALETRTEGWIASLQLAALSMKGRSDVTGFIQAFTGSNLYVAEYLIEEVLKHQPEEVETFLLQTSILNGLTADLCEAVTGNSDGQTMLKELYQANLFVLPLDDEAVWFRYHHLFADLLKARLPQRFPEIAIAAFHQRAASWYEQAGMIAEAIDHALAARDYSYLVKLVEKSALPMILQAHVRTVEGWLQVIPQNLIEQNPRINMAFTWLNLLRGTPEQATAYLERLKAIFSAAGASTQDPTLLGEWLALQSKLMGLQGRSIESRDLANQALAILTGADAHVRSMVLVNLSTAYQQMLDYEHAIDTLQSIVQEARTSGNFALEIMGISGQAQMVLQQGKLHLGFELATQGLERMEATGKSTPFGATFYGELGQIHYQWHQLDQARSYFLRSMQASGSSGYSDPEIYQHVMLSHMCQLEADWEAAAREMEIAKDLARTIPPAMIRENVISQQVRVDLAMNRLAAAQAILKPEGFTFDGSSDPFIFIPGTNVTHPVGLLYNSALRVLLYLANTNHEFRNLKRALELASLVLASELQCQQIEVVLETLLLRSQMHAILGDEHGRLDDVLQALEVAEPEGFISIFVEEGQPIELALAILLKRNLLGVVKPAYVREILTAFPKAQSLKAVLIEGVDDDLTPIELLTPREREVLQLMATGDSNQTIAERLVITLSAVKKHTGNIFRKLNVSNRTQAVTRARFLGLLSIDY